jgi:phenylalanyl-tRNA synthetase beta chain
VRAVRFVEQYDGKGIPEGKKSVTLGITLRDDSATLEGAAIETIMGDIQKKLEKEFGAQVR